ncbi:Hypothetical predicted protein [Mytilus galloprovincialis]|uniref:Uncharacterized protein n=1 Tax=Mytilus galloprovincialis TaxID=29158 RepID=A0A8B6CRW4_MYTGA|nr:Hypothetical predicted protein [Mytilus galloprovincialis]
MPKVLRDLRVTLESCDSESSWIKVRFHIFPATLKQYRKLRKLKSCKYCQEIVNRLDTLNDTNPKEYWKLLYQLKTKDKFKTDEESNVPEADWYDYFRIFDKETYSNTEMDIL